ncbi:MAG TPA: IS110 family transposase [Actinomycetota bacterium]|nr:IS110 family transposase [Actinomycetota bacterium]
MANPTTRVIGGIDTHKQTHYAAAIDDQGRLLGHREFPARAQGYRDLLAWLRSHGQILTIGVEGTGNFGAALTRHLSAAGEQVLEVNKPNHQARHMDGKSDRLDSEQIARAVLAETGIATPKSKAGPVEVIRTLRVARASAIRARTQAFNLLFHTMISGPSEVRDGLVDLTRRTLVNRCLALEPETENLLDLIVTPDRMVVSSVRFTLRDLARRWKTLDAEVKELSGQIKQLVEHVAPKLVEVFGVSTELAGQFLVTAGDNPERIRNEAAFAKLCGVSPKPASSGRTSGRHRLNRGGDRAANSALYIVTIVRLRHHQPTREYVERRTAEGLTKREIIRCLKRYIVREVFAALPRSEAQIEIDRAA